MPEMYSKPEKHLLILGTIILLLYPEILNYRDHRSGQFDRNVEFLVTECMSIIPHDGEKLLPVPSKAECEERAKWQSNSWSDVLVPAIVLIIFWWLFIGPFIFWLIKDIPIIKNLFVRIYGHEYEHNGLPKLQGGEDFQFKSSFDLLEGFKENPTSQMYTDLTVAINLYTKKYPKFTSIVTEEDFKNYINWAIQETDNVFKNETQKSKIQKESLTKLLNKLNKKIRTTNE